MAATLARAIYAFESGESGDLTFYEGDVIEILSREGDWWRGRTKDGRTGIFPYNRVELLTQQFTQGRSSAVKSVQVPQSGEKISKVSVELKELRRSRRGHAIFTVRVDLENRQQLVFDKNMGDFRKMDNALKLLDPGFEYIHMLPPSWADEIPLSNSQARQRARSLTKYLAHNTNGREVFDILILSWVKSTKAGLRNAPSSNRVQLNASDSRNAVNDKVMGALAYIYQEADVDPTTFFTGQHSLVQVRYDWTQRDDTEISLTKWEYVLVLQERTQYDGWWFGQRTKGEKGLFPSNYVLKTEASELRKIFKKRAQTEVGMSRSNTPDGGSQAMRSPTRQYTSPSPSRNARPSPQSPSRMLPIQNEPSNMSGGRDRKLESNFCVKSIDAYEELTRKGLTMELNGRPIKLKKGGMGGPRKGDFVVVHFNAYVWDPQTQTLREFSSSDQLKAPPKGVESGMAGRSGFKMEFSLGKNEVIDGLEEAVSYCEQGKTYRAVISPAKGYGDVGSPPEIPGNCYLAYDLTLERVAKQGPIDRRQIFSVGISRPNVQVRPQQRAKEYQGMKSIGERQRRRKDRSRNYNNGGYR